MKRLKSVEGEKLNLLVLLFKRSSCPFQVNVEGLPCFIFPMHTSLHYNAYFIVIMVINTLSPQVLFVESLVKVNFGRV